MAHVIFASNALLADGWAQDVRVTIDDGIITAITPNSARQSADLNLDNQLLLPAVANLHSHTFQRAMAGLSEKRGSSNDSFWTWREVMYRFLDHLSPDDIHAIAAYSFMEMAEAGFSAVGEFHYVHHQPGGVPYDNIAETSRQIIEAANQIGVGLTHLPVLYSYGGVDKEPLQGGQLRFGNNFDRFAQMVTTIDGALATAPADYRLGVAPHSLRAVDLDQLQQVATLRPNEPIHIHIAEQLPEVAAVQAAYGARPVEWLLNNMKVNERWCLIHATHLTPEETIGIAKSGAVAGLCPITEANLGDGIFDGARFFESKGAFGVGSDSNLRISLSEELRTLEHSQRYAEHARTVLADKNSSNAEGLLQNTALGGAKALGRNAGRIEVAALADMMSIAPSDWLGDGLSPSDTLDYWVFASRVESVSHLWSAGRHIVKDGRHIHRDEIVAPYLATLTKLRSLL